MTRSWIFRKCLSCIRCFTFMFPKLSSLRLWQETLRFLSDKNAIWIVSCVILSLLFNRNDGFVCARTWWQSSFFPIFAVGYFWLENLVLAARIKLLLSSFLIVIYSWTGILRPTHVVVGHVGLLEKLSFYLAWCKVVFREAWMDGRHLRVIRCWTDLIKANTSISGLRQFLRWNTWCLGCWNDGQVFVLLGTIFISRLVKIGSLIPLDLLVVMARIWVGLVARASYQTWSWSSRTKSCDL